MITKKGVYLLEYNMRMGDPETQAVLPLLENDLLELISKAFDKKLSEVEIKWKPLHSCCVVGASAGYPENYENGNLILGIEEYTENEENILFLAGSKSDENGNFLTNGGRVLNAVGLGKTLEEARKNAYSLIGKIKFDGIYFRKDIGIY